eukprot:4314-Eustigmatos_ZCMA.PRE.1
MESGYRAAQIIDGTEGRFPNLPRLLVAVARPFNHEITKTDSARSNVVRLLSVEAACALHHPSRRGMHGG